MRSILVAEITATKFTEITNTNPTHLELPGIIWLRINLTSTSMTNCKRTNIRFTSGTDAITHSKSSLKVNPQISHDQYILSCAYCLTSHLPWQHRIIYKPHNHDNNLHIQDVHPMISHKIGMPGISKSSPTPTIIIATSVAFTSAHIQRWKWRFIKISRNRNASR